MTGLKNHQWYLLAPVFGLLLTTAFAPYDWAYGAVLALIFFYRACLSQTARQAALTAYLFGLGLFASGIWWVYVSIHDYGGADPISAGLLTALLIALWALFPALTAYLTVKLLPIARPGWRLPVLALCWVGIEYLRGRAILNGFPWLQIAYSQLNTPLAGYAPLFGVYGLGFMLALSAGCLAEAGQGGFSYRRGIGLFLCIWLLGGALKTWQWTQPAGDPFKATLLQGNIPQDQKWLAEQRLPTLQLYDRLTRQHWDSDVIIWPESAIPVFLSEIKTNYLQPLAAEARYHGVSLIVSLPTEGEGSDYYNSVMTLGETEAFYHKHHLLPFGEYLPLQPLSGWVLDQLNIPLGSFTAGADRQPLLTAAGHAFITSICYEDAFGELAISQLEQAAYLVNVTNDAWFGNTSEPYQHMQMAQMRALETGRYLIRATNTGVSAVVSPDGQISQQAPVYTTTTLTAAITPMRGLTPYARIGDDGVFAGLLLTAVLAWAGDRYRRSKPA